jgi:hypothetical protein
MPERQTAKGDEIFSIYENQLCIFVICINTFSSPRLIVIASYEISLFIAFRGPSNSNNTSCPGKTVNDI